MFTRSAIHQTQALYDFFKLTLINILVRNGEAHLKNIGIIYHNLEHYRLGQIPKTERKLAPFFDIVSTTPYIQDDTMALTLTGSKCWPKWKVLEKFAKQHCALNKQKTDQALNEVCSARDHVLPLLQQLSNTHHDFTVIADTMTATMQQSF